MPRPILASFALLILLGAVVAGSPRSADACSPPPPVWVVEPDGQPITDIPIAGVVPIFASVYGSGEGVTVSVTGADGQPVPGSAEYFTDRVVWRAAQPLEPNTAYDMMIEDDWGTLEMLEFTTGADGDPGLPDLDATGVLTEAERVSDSICCDSGSLDTCSGEPEYYPCWAQEYRYQPLLQLEFAIDDQVRRFWQFEAVGSGASRVGNSLDAYGENGVSATFDRERDRYCVTVTATSLLTGDQVSAVHCALASELTPIERSDPETPDSAACSGDLVDGETGEEIPPDVIDDLTGEDGGCSAARGSRDSSHLPTCLIAVALLVGRRRRGRLAQSRRRPERRERDEGFEPSTFSVGITDEPT